MKLALQQQVTLPLMLHYVGILWDKGADTFVHLSFAVYISNKFSVSNWGLLFLYSQINPLSTRTLDHFYFLAITNRAFCVNINFCVKFSVNFCVNINFHIFAASIEMITSFFFRLLKQWIILILQ